MQVKSLFLEVEVTRSLYSNNLVKGFRTFQQSDEKRVIDTNTLATKRIEEVTIKMQQSENIGFVSGLEGEVVDALLGEDGEPTQVITSGNVIKAREEADAFLEQARADAQRILAQAAEEAKSVRERAVLQAEQDKMKIWEQARKDGFEEGKKQAMQEVDVAKAQFQEQIKEIEAEYQTMVDELEPEFVDLITGIYEHIFHVELESYREILTHLICTTMRKVEGNRDFIIHVSAEDYPYVSMQKKQIVAGATSAGSQVEIIEDITLTKGECLIETEGGIFDCGLGTQLTELRQKLKLLSYEK